MKYDEVINQIILDVLSDKVTLSDLTPEKRLIEDLGASSIQLLELSLAIAAELDIDVPKEEVINMSILNDVYVFVANKKGKK